MAVFYGGEYYDMKENPQISEEDYETEESYKEALEKRIIEIYCVIKFNQWKLGEIEAFDTIVELKQAVELKPLLPVLKTNHF